MALTEAEGLLRIAIADLETAIASSDPKVFREGAWGFWLQQSVEKALKAWLVHRGEVPPLTHDLNRLLRRLEGHEVETENLQSLGQLTLFAVQVRYGVDPQPLGLDRAVFNAKVRELLEQVEEILRNGAA
jgi:HEPN domain-containing protein